MTRSFAVLLAISLLALSGCASAPKNAEPAKHYPMTGEIISVNAKDQTAQIKHGQIGDWMEPMTMDYPIKDKTEFQALRVGEKISATVDVRGTDYEITGIKEQSTKK